MTASANAASSETAAGQSTARQNAGRGAAQRFIDAFDVSRRGLTLTGQVLLAEFSRMGQGLPEQTGHAHWTLQGMTGAQGQALLRLQVQGAPRVSCQRCLEVFEWPVDDEVVLQLVRSEAELDAEDAPLDGAPEDGYDKVLGTGRFDVLAQVEDQFILALPYIARHDECPSGALPSAAGDDEPVVDERPNPFAGLAALKGKLKSD